MTNNNKETDSMSFSERTANALSKIASPMASFAKLPSISAIQEGLMSSIPITIAGSLFLILTMLSAVIPPLTQYMDSILNVYSMTLGFIGFYVAYAIAHSYGEKLGLDTKLSGLIGILAFFFICYDDVSAGMLSTSYFGSTGMFVAMVASIVSVRIYKFFIDRKIVIKLPDGVPPSVGNSFSSLIPVTVIITLAWFIRSILKIDLAVIVMNFFTPLLSGADSLGFYTLIMFLTLLLWSIGLNGPSMLAAITTPIVTNALACNAAAKVAGESMQYIWTSEFNYSYLWLCSIYPLLLLLVLSKSKTFMAVGIASIPSALFNIIEPVVFGLPLAMNAYLMIPFVISGTVGCALSYFLTMIGFVGKAFIDVPFVTPPFVAGFLISGDWKALIAQLITFVIGVIIYLPFFKIFEKKTLEEERNAENENS
ncbi:MAG: PTS sugar transporter subunit IIC [Erysipelotrichaceae bacterium]|nr:PTS sugar transporter subunit IIC [Erysipelotrichaceae bacterium]